MDSLWDKHVKRLNVPKLRIETYALIERPALFLHDCVVNLRQNSFDYQAFLNYFRHAAWNIIWRFLSRDFSALWKDHILRSHTVAILAFQQQLDKN